MLAWAATGIFVLGAGLLTLFFVSGNAGPFGIGAVYAGLIMALGVVLLGAFVAASLSGHESGRSRWRGLAAGAGLIAAVSLLVVFLAAVVGMIKLPVDPLFAAAGVITFTSIAALVLARRGERPPALVFAVAWVLLLAVIGYRGATDVDVRVVWLGPGSTGEGPVWIAFSGTRSADFEIRHGANSCSEGELVASGRYEFRDAPLGARHGEPIWVELPAAALPLRRGDLLRVCLRDGLAAGTAAGEVVSPPSFRPLD